MRQDRSIRAIGRNSRGSNAKIGGRSISLNKVRLPGLDLWGCIEVHFPGFGLWGYTAMHFPGFVLWGALECASMAVGCVCVFIKKDRNRAFYFETMKEG